MAKYSIEELMEVLAVKRGSIRVWKNRGKIVFNEFDEFDTSVTINAEFFNRKLEEKQGLREKPKTPTTGKNSKGATKKKKDITPKVEQPTQAKQPELVPQKSEYQKKKEELELIKLQRDIDLKDADLAKKHGDFINAKTAVDAIKRWSMAKDDYLLQQFEKRIQYICDREAIPADRAAKYIKEVPAIINEASKEATDKMKGVFGDE